MHSGFLLQCQPPVVVWFPAPRQPNSGTRANRSRTNVSGGPRLAKKTKAGQKATAATVEDYRHPEATRKKNPPAKIRRATVNVTDRVVMR